ncbi:13827_t:CDS:1, partial [Acaulospora colombiana]
MDVETSCLFEHLRVYQPGAALAPPPPLIACQVFIVHDSYPVD